MGIVDFFVPKWKRSNPEIRLHAIEEMSSKTALNILQELATTDPDPNVRIAAILKITDLECLKEISDVNSDTSVTKTISGQFDLVYSEMIIEDPESHINLLEKIDDETILTSIAVKTRNPSIRIGIVNRISDERNLCTIVENNCGFKAGELIVKKLSNKESLEFTANNASSKKIKKLAKEKIAGPKKKESPSTEEKKESLEEQPRLSPVIEVEQIDSAVEETILKLSTLCAEMKKVCSAPVGSDRSQADQLIANWTGLDKAIISSEILSEYQTRFNSMAESFNKRHSEFLQLKEKEHALIARLKTMCEEAESLLDSESDKSSTWTDLKKNWKLTYIESPKTTELNKTFQGIIIKNRELSLDRLKSSLSDLCSTVEKAVDQLDEKKRQFELMKSVKAAQNSWKRLSKNTAREIPELQDRFKKSCSLFFEKHSEQVENHQWELWANLKKKEELYAETEKIKSFAHDGSVSQLAALAARARSIWSRWKKIGPIAKNETINSRFTELYNEICQPCIDYKAALYKKIVDISQSENWNENSDALKGLTDQWTRIGNIFVQNEKELNLSFKKACDLFYQNRREYFRKRDEKRIGNIEIKKEICIEAERLKDSEDFIKTANELKDLQKRWKKTGPAPKKEDDLLWERFRSACNVFFERFEQIKNDNLQIKKELCKKIELITDLPDDFTEIEKIRKEILKLQKIWKQTGPVPYEEEKKIWEQFRKPCDDFFMHRNAVLLKMEPAFQKNMETLGEFIQEAETISLSSGLKEGGDRIKEVQALWKEVGPIHPDEERKLNAQFRKICNTFFTSSRKKFKELSQDRDKNLKIKQEICLTAETICRIVAPDSATSLESEIPMAEQLNMALELKDEIHVEGNRKETVEKAIKKVKLLELQWKETGPIPKKVAGVIHIRFKKAVDMVYRCKNERTA